MGKFYQRPVVQELVDSGAAVVLPEDIFQWGGSDVFGEKLMKTVKELLAEPWPCEVSPYGQRVDAGWLEKNLAEYFLFLINREKAGTTPVDISLHLPEGRYELYVRDADFWYRGCLSGKKELSAQDLISFRDLMIPETACVFYLRKAG
ncbi:MAG TPA: hypothetical protein PKW42_03345 [bacterium]|nr:hypothetical protein [bacterium]HPP11748.1 hypothetical protein [bacterium]